METLERIRRAEAQAGPPPVHARVRVVNKAGVSDQSELESESEYSQMSDYYHDKLRLGKFSHKMSMITIFVMKNRFLQFHADSSPS